VTSTEDLAYVAGFFDGEGSVSIVELRRARGEAPHGGRIRLRLYVSLSQKDPSVLEWIRAEVLDGGGYINRGRDIAYLSMSDAVAERFLQSVLPYLRVKREQAAIGLRLRATCRPPSGPDRSPLTQSTVQLRKELRCQLLAANARGKGPRHPSAVALARLL
jgi:hypothetical protein